MFDDDIETEEEELFADEDEHNALHEAYMEEVETIFEEAKDKIADLLHDVLDDCLTNEGDQDE